MICVQCKSRNPIGNKFCRECGGKLVAPEGTMEAEEMARIEGERKQEKVAELLAKAFSLCEIRQYDTALPLAQEAADLLPTSTSAHALLATLYERTGQNDKAVSALERVVELNPDSAADRIKLEQVKRGVHVAPKHEPAKLPLPAWVPFAVAGGVTAFVLGFGMAFVNRSAAQGKQTAAVLPARPIAPTIVNPATPVLPTTASVAPTLPANQYIPQRDGVIPREDPFTPLNGVSTASAPTVSRPLPPLNVPRRRPSLSGGFVPPAPVTISESAGNGMGSLPPIGGVTSQEATGGISNGAFGAGGRVNVGPPPANTSGASSSGGGEGYIRIQVGPPHNATPPTPAPEPTPAPDPNPLARARRLQSTGRYNEAISAYREAIGEGAGGDAQQGIAQSYQRLGNEAAAREAYRDAILAYEAQAASGRSVASAQRGVASCKAALEVLGG